MTKDERKVESILLQERWKLIQQGTSRKHISKRRSEIYVGKLLHAKVIDQSLYCVDPQKRLLIPTQHHPLLLKQKWNMLKPD